MNGYCVFLKQVYFRRKFIKMNDLEELFKEIGFQDAKTILATGNVIFKSEKVEYEIYSIIKENLLKHYSFDIDIFIKSFEGIRDILIKNPFEIRKEFYLQTFICGNNFQEMLIKEFNKIDHLEFEEALVKDKILYWTYKKCNKIDSHFLKLLSKDKLKHNFTIRTIGSIQKICNKISQ